MKIISALFSLLVAFSPAAVFAQSTPVPYGAPISLGDAKRIITAAGEEATKNNWNVVITVVDSGGHLVALERMDNAQYASIDVSHGKARTAVAFRRPSKAMQTSLGAGGEALRSLAIPDLFPIEGGLPLVQDGKIVGAIGVSGVTSEQDGQIAAAGMAALKK
jgi:uncharacterized protein GlcG (DUF336 family)